MVGALSVGSAARSLGSGGNRDRRVLRVGLEQELKSIAAAARVARDGDIVEVEAGPYTGDVAVWSRDDLTLRAVGGPVVLNAAGASAEGKALWVVRAERARVEGFTFSGVTVTHRNGAGIRLERGSLDVRKCLFVDNENGILTSNRHDIVLRVEDCEFARNGAGDGQSHNLYAGVIAALEITGCYFHDARVGHLLKSRAARNLVSYSRLTDDGEGTSSYELEFPNGGFAVVLGCLLRQGPATQNSTIVSYGAEGLLARPNRFWLVNNTLVDDRTPAGRMVHVAAGDREVAACNNLLVGGGLRLPGDAALRNNFAASRHDFADVTAFDYRLRRGSPLAGRGLDPDWSYDPALRVVREYAHPAGSRSIVAAKLSPGAFQSLGP